MSNVSVMGIMNDGMGGIKESQAAFRKHWKETGDALLNIAGIATKTGAPVDKDDPREPYTHQDLPKMLYHPEKGEHICYKVDEVEAMLKKGWRKEPYIKPQVALEDPKAEKVMLQSQLKQKDGEIATLTDTMLKMAGRLEALEAKAQEAPAKSK